MKKPAAKPNVQAIGKSGATSMFANGAIMGSCENRAHESGKVAISADSVSARESVTKLNLPRGVLPIRYAIRGANKAIPNVERHESANEMDMQHSGSIAIRPSIATPTAFRVEGRRRPK